MCHNVLIAVRILKMKQLLTCDCDFDNKIFCRTLIVLNFNDTISKLVQVVIALFYLKWENTFQKCDWDKIMKLNF